MNLFTRKNSNDLLKYLEPKEVEHVSRIEIINIFEAGAFVFHENDEIENIYLIESGTVFILKKNFEGLDVIVEELQSGETFGELCFTFDKSIYSAKIAKSTVLKVYPCKKLKEIIEKNSEISSKILAAINDSLTIKNIKITQKLSE